MANTDQISRAYSFLLSIKNNIPEDFEVEDRWVKDFNNEVDRLEKSLGFDLQDFKVNMSELRKSIASYAPPDPWSEGTEGETIYRPGLWIDRSRLMVKVDSLLNHFSIEAAPGAKIVFQK